jgi:hypothetical protein
MRTVLHIALLWAAVPGEATARPSKVAVWYPRPTAKPEPCAWADDAVSAAFREGTATVCLLGEGLGSSNLWMRYELKDADVSFGFFGPRDDQVLRWVLPGPEHTLVITAEHAVVTAGYASAARGETGIVLDGERVWNSNTYSFHLPSGMVGRDIAGYRLQSAGLAVDPGGGGATVFFLGRDGRLLATRLECSSEPYVEVRVAAFPDRRLVWVDDVVLLVRPSSRQAYALRASFRPRRELSLHDIALPWLPIGELTIRPSGAEYLLEAEGDRFALIDDPRGEAAAPQVDGAASEGPLVCPEPPPPDRPAPPASALPPLPRVL